jgi:hypothetical protein
MPPTTPNSAPNPNGVLSIDEEPEPEVALPEEEFWDRYNKRLEFPIATVATVFLHVVVGAILVYVLVGLMDGGEDRSNPPLQLIAVSGADDTGEGSSGSGGQENPDIVRDVDPFVGVRNVLPTPESLADAKADIQKMVLPDTTGNLPISAPNAAAYSQLDDTIRKKLLGVGSQKGEGNQPGKGFDGSAGSGPGGVGSDSTRARGLRWVLRFRVASGKDYLDQLRAMGAEILVPLDDKKPPQSILVPDLENPTAQRVASDADYKRLAGKIQFSDTRKDQVREVCAALGVKTDAKTFWAFFPKSLEEELAHKEKSYRNRRSEDIEETIFRVVVRGGKFELVIDDQRVKK